VNKEWTEALAASDRGSYSEQDQLLELDGLDKEEDKVVPVYSTSRLNICPIFPNMRCRVSKQSCVAATPFTFESLTFHKISQHFTAPCHGRKFTEGLHFSSFSEDSERAELCRFYRVKNRYIILFAALQIQGRNLCMYTGTSKTKIWQNNRFWSIQILNSPPDVTHALRRNSEYPLYIYTVLLLLERVKEAFLP